MAPYIAIVWLIVAAFADRESDLFAFCALSAVVWALIYIGDSIKGRA